MPKAYYMVLFVYIQCRKNTEIHPTATQVNTLHICLFSWYKNLCIVLSMSFCRLLFQTPTFPLLPPFFLHFFFLAPPNPSEVTTISTRVNQSRHTSAKHTRPVLCHRVSVFISSCYDFSWSLVVWCWYRWWCCACVDEYSPMVLISCHLLDEPSQ